MANREGKVYVFDHPLIQHKTALMRDVNTSVKEFRELATEVAMLMGFEATRDLPLEEVDIETPMCKTTVKMLEGEDCNRSYLKSWSWLCGRNACARSKCKGRARWIIPRPRHTSSC